MSYLATMQFQFDDPESELNVEDDRENTGDIRFQWTVDGVSCQWTDDELKSQPIQFEPETGMYCVLPDEVWNAMKAALKLFE